MNSEYISDDFVGLGHEKLVMVFSGGRVFFFSMYNGDIML